MEPTTEPHPDSSNSNYAFITHSQETLPRNLPPSIGNATLARRRRRRTSVHDQAILEEEYRKCDRPDKTKRKEITGRVQMGEKEVQIWFQNKRQSARRKAKPLLPHEVIPNNNSSSQYSCQPSSSQYSSFDNSQSFSSSQREETMHQTATSFNSDVLRRASVSSGIDCPSPPLADAFGSDVSASQGSGAYLGLSDADDDEELEDYHHHHHHHHHHQQQQQQQRYEHPPHSKRQRLSRNLEQSSPTFLPNHLSQHQRLQQNHVSLNNHKLPEPEMTTSAHQRLQDVLLSTPSQPIKSASSRRTNPTTPYQPPRLLKRSSSIRLSTSLEGKATVVLDEEPESPPPSQILPTPKKPIPNSVCRSTGPARKIIDSKIWEFYCDNQAMIRSPAQLSTQPAEAKQALGMLRKKDGSSSKPPIHNAIESPVTQRKTGSSHRRTVRSSPTKARKSRKVISQKSSRLKPVSVDHKKSHASTKKLVDHQDFPLELGQESDKENRPPGAPVSPPPEPRRRLGVSGKGEVGGAKKNPDKTHRKKKRHTTDERKILGDHKSIPSQTTSAGVFYEIPSSSQYVEEREGEPVGDEVAGSSQQSFSYFESSQDSTISLPPARVDEMECVENLLSLRGGTWR